MSSPTANCRFFGNLQYSHSARRSQFVGDFGAGRPSSVADCPGRWRWVQSAANPSPCYLANIRVIFENNSDPAAKKAKRPCGAGTSDHRANFDNREKQGGSLQSSRVRPANKQRAERQGCKTSDLSGKRARMVLFRQHPHTLPGLVNKTVLQRSWLRLIQSKGRPTLAVQGPAMIPTR